MLKKAKNLSEIPNAFPAVPLRAEDFASFYVDIDCERDSCLSRVEELKRKLSRNNAKIFFAGHRGSGKSTELNRLKMIINNNSFVVSFSVSEELDINDLNYVDIIMVAMEKLAIASVSAGLINENSDHLEKIKEWLSVITEINENDTGYMLEVNAGLHAKTGILSPLIGIIAEFKASIKASSRQKVEYRQKIEQRISLLTANCNILINDIEIALRKQDKRLLIIIEDIDKVDIVKVRDIFFKSCGSYEALNTRIIFTISIFALMCPERADSIFDEVRLPMPKIKNRDQSRYEKGYDAITEILKKRTDLSLFEEKVIDKIIFNSGGVLRDLFLMIETASNSADYANRSQISIKDADYALNQIKARYLGMITVPEERKDRISTNDLYEKLIELYSDKNKKIIPDDSFLILLSCLAIIEYNGEQWFDLHPAVVALLKDMGKIEA